MKRQCVLVVDDERDCADSIAQILSIHGYEVCVAYSIKSARRILFHEGEGIQIIITDYKLSDGTAMDLTDALPRVAIVLTGCQNTLPFFDCHLRKPVTPQQLCDEVRKCLRKKVMYDEV